jgi:crotonobetainyl-CoA:carnitine CoA-transferase CaiB-like acyl-CoA transferase
MSARATPSPLPLAGVKVLDLSRVLAGPWCTQILADFGADVVKIEAQISGDDTRSWGPPYLETAPDEEGPGESAYYLSCNRNKRSLAIDLASPKGGALIRRMAAEADVVVENFKVGGLRKYGLDFASLIAINPRLVYCSVTGFGQDGPYAARGGYDFVAQAMGGLMSITGEADGSPLKVGVAITDLSTGMYAAVSILVALRHAEQTGQGQHIDCSLLDTQIAMLANQGMTHLVSGVTPGRMGNAHPTVVPYRAFHVADGHFVVAAGNNAQYRALCDAVGCPDLGTDPRFATNSDRVRNRAVLEPLLQEAMSTITVAQLSDSLDRAGVPCGPVNDIKAVFADPFVENHQLVRHFDGEDGMSIPTVAYPSRLSETPAQYRRRPPRLGEHSAEVLSQWLGLSDEEVSTLQRDKLIGRKTS